LTAREARHKIAQKYAKERAKEEATKQRNWQKMLNAEKAELHKRGVAARKAERLRKKEVLQL
jgi:UDP-2,3-diacylglucosamine pyrophosphatase LpxH